MERRRFPLTQPPQAFTERHGIRVNGVDHSIADVDHLRLRTTLRQRRLKRFVQIGPAQ